MDIYYLKVILGLSAALIASIVLLARWKLLGKADKPIAILVVCGFITDFGSFILARTISNNYILYHIYGPVALGLGCFYYAWCIPALYRRKIGLWLTVLGVVLAIINTRYFQSIKFLNSYFLMVEGCIIIVLSLFSFYYILTREDEVVPYPYAIFWISVIFLFYWSLTIASFGLYKWLVSNPIINNVLYSAGVLYYLSLTFVFIRYRKLIPSGG